MRWMRFWSFGKVWTNRAESSRPESGRLQSCAAGLWKASGPRSIPYLRRVCSRRGLHGILEIAVAGRLSARVKSNLRSAHKAIDDLIPREVDRIGSGSRETKIGIR